MTCFKQLSRPEDLATAIFLLQICSPAQSCIPTHCSLSSKKVAEISHLNSDLPSALDGYHTALQLLPKGSMAWPRYTFSSRVALSRESRRSWLSCCNRAIQLGPSWRSSRASRPEPISFLATSSLITKWFGIVKRGRTRSGHRAWETLSTAWWRKLFTFSQYSH